MEHFSDFIYTLFTNKHLLHLSSLVFDFLATHQVAAYSVTITILCIASSLESLQKMIENGRLNRRLAKIATERPRILNEGGDRKILVIGDSTAYGTGADRVEDTLLGRFAHDFPYVEVNNYAVNGSGTKDAVRQIEKVDNTPYNLIIISTGGNDTWKLTKLKDVEANLRTLLAKAKSIAGNNVIVIIYNNIASGPVFPLIVRPIIILRTNAINALLKRVSDEFGIESVPIFLDGEKCPDNFFARDGLHPSSEGYRIMYIRLWSVLYKRMYDFKLRDY